MISEAQYGQMLTAAAARSPTRQPRFRHIMSSFGTPGGCVTRAIAKNKGISPINRLVQAGPRLAAVGCCLLTLLRNSTAGNVNRLGVAIAHLEAAISHINNEAQRHVPPTRGGASREVEDLRLIVSALADIIEALRSGASESQR
jgi:hypothetical protein